MRRVCSWTVVVALAATGCAWRVERGSATDLPVPPSGIASSRFVADAANPARGLPQGTRLWPPEPDPTNREPDYPAEALDASASARVGVRFFVETDGRVSAAGPSPIVPDSAGPLAATFRAAAESAVRDWRFEPAYLVPTVEGKDLDGDGIPDYRRATSIDPVRVYLDVRFDFDIVSGKGVVRFDRRESR